MPIKTWFSQSKQRAIPLNEMPTNHLLNAYKKCLAGEGFNAEGEPLSPDEQTELCNEFIAEFNVRGIDVPTYADED